MAELSKEMQAELARVQERRDEAKRIANAGEANAAAEVEAVRSAVQTTRVLKYRTELLSELATEGGANRLAALNDSLQRLGSEDWELAAILPWDGDTLLIFKQQNFE